MSLRVCAFARLRVICIFLICGLLCSTAAVAEDWKEYKSDHFIVYYLDGEGFASDVSRWSERYYERIASDLGYARYDNFWMWDNRAKIYIYRDREQFLKATGAQSWSYGFTVYENKEIVSFADNPKFLEALLPHELAHLIFRDFVGFKGQVPMWLDEGVAQWEEEGKRAVSIDMVKELIARKEIIPLDRLMHMNISAEGSAEVSAKFYAEAVSLVGFMIKKYGESRFTQFCRQLRDGSKMDTALSAVYPDSIRNMGELEKEWLKYYGGS